LLIWSLVPAAAALAHHSYAAYDQNHVNTVEGTLEDFDWSAPHSSMTVVYLDKTGSEQRVSATTGAPNTIVQGHGLQSGHEGRAEMVSQRQWLARGRIGSADVARWQNAAWAWL
jgi:hypothetical protein